MKEEFSGKNLTRFEGSGLIRRFLKRHKIKGLFDSRVRIEGRNGRKYLAGTIFVSFLYGNIPSLFEAPSYEGTFC